MPTMQDTKSQDAQKRAEADRQEEQKRAEANRQEEQDRAEADRRAESAVVLSGWQERLKGGKLNSYTSGIPVSVHRASGRGRTIRRSDGRAPSDRRGSQIVSNPGFDAEKSSRLQTSAYSFIQDLQAGARETRAYKDQLQVDKKKFCAYIAQDCADCSDTKTFNFAIALNMEDQKQMKLLLGSMNKSPRIQLAPLGFSKEYSTTIDAGKIVGRRGIEYYSPCIFYMNIDVNMSRLTNDDLAVMSEDILESWAINHLGMGADKSYRDVFSPLCIMRREGLQSKKITIIPVGLFAVTRNNVLLTERGEDRDLHLQTHNKLEMGGAIDVSFVIKNDGSRDNLEITVNDHISKPEIFYIRVRSEAFKMERVLDAIRVKAPSKQDKKELRRTAYHYAIITFQKECEKAENRQRLASRGQPNNPGMSLYHTYSSTRICPTSGERVSDYVMGDGLGNTISKPVVTEATDGEVEAEGSGVAVTEATDGEVEAEGLGVAVTKSTDGKVEAEGSGVAVSSDKCSVQRLSDSHASPLAGEKSGLSEPDLPLAK